MAHGEPGGASDPRALFEDSLELIDRIVASASRRLGLGADETDDLRSWVHLELIEGDYRVLREFGGRSTLATFLTAVIQNLARDYRIKRWGRWRPSAAAERLGLEAIRLETLLYRDGFSFDEAAESLRANERAKMSRAEIAELAGRLPQRVRLRFEGEDGVATAVADSRPDRLAMDSERKAILARSRRVLAESLAGLSAEDRLVLKMHYRSGLTLSAIARALEHPQRRLYTRRDRALRHLRAAFERAGLKGGAVLEALGRSEEDFEAGPSNPVNPQAEGGS